MKIPPRNPRKEKMIDFGLFVHAYLFLGMLESFFSFLMYFWYMHSEGGFTPSDLLLAFDKWDDGYKGKTFAQLSEILYGAQTAYFVCLTTMQFGNLFSTRTRTASIFQHNPLKKETRNLTLFAGVIASLALVLIITLIPFCQNTFNLRPIPYQFWLLPYAYAIFLFACDEVRKLILRRNSC